MTLFKPRGSHRRLPRTVLSLALLAGLVVLACDLDNGNKSDLPTDPSVVADLSAISLSVFIDPGNIPADGDSYSTIHAKVLNDGVPVAGVPILFYSEWGTVFTACGTPTTVTVGKFTDAIITGPDGDASTLVQAPVLPNLYKNEQESNTIAAFALIDGVIVRAINNQNLWQVNLDSFSCKRVSGNKLAVTAKLSGRGVYPVSGCASAVWTTTSGLIADFTDAQCTDHGTTSITVQTDPNVVPKVTKGTVQLNATFNGAGLNECVLDENRSLSVIGQLQVDVVSGTCKAL